MPEPTPARPRPAAAPQSSVAPDRLAIREVGPRDGLQVEAPLPVATRVRLVEELASAGLREIEAVSFVSPARVPSMAGAAKVLAALRREPGVRYLALVPNQRGAELAIESGVDGLSVTLSASEEYSIRNVGRDRSGALAEARRTVALASPLTAVDVVISCAFGGPGTEPLDCELVEGLASELRGCGASTVTLADTTGEATPTSVAKLLAATGTDVGLHLHDSRRTALLGAYVALGLGVRRLDTSVAGLGGSPFAEGTGGNLATEDLVHLAADLGLQCGVDLDRLLQASRWLSGLLGRPRPAPLALVGPARPLRNGPRR
ncbi:MAG: hydroxymethylglutaryl-CoA lyase [Acidimicrobiales bacterium]